ncbi:MAG: PHP domain-containing protein [Chloroflexota bacterium]|nr:PHP domain-containing protein [Chloroflexota bacterium]
MPNPIYADFHVHTHLSPCGKPEATAGAMIRRAREKGLAAIGFADHFTPDPIPNCPFYDHQRLHILTDLRAEIAQVADRADIEVLVGVEADYTIAGQACLDPAVLAQADHVICAASHFHLPIAPQPTGDEPRAKAELMYRLACKALVLPGVSVWAHPFHCRQVRPLLPILETISAAGFAALVALANEREVAVEINGGAVQYVWYRQATARFFCLAREMGARFTITADAHHPDHFARLDLALEWARRLGFRDEDFLTAQELRERQGRKTT